MPLTLHVAGDRWREHLRSVVADQPGLVPVAKGNGYGFGLGRLARRTAWLGLPALAVGQYDELPEVAQRFDGDLLVLSPYRDFYGVEAIPDAVPERLRHRVVHTVGREQDLTALAAAGEPGGTSPRVIAEIRTSMLRHGFTGPQIRSLRLPPGVRLEGVSLHFPLGTGHRAAAERALGDVVAASLPTRTVWVSHLSTEDLAALRSAWPDFTFRPRVGTALWLGDRAALQVRATVLDAHPVRRGDPYGYRQRTAPRAGTILVVSGGTAHGIGLEAPTGESSLRARVGSIARGGLDATGWARSPYLIEGRQPFFAEPPHMQASMLFLPGGRPVPAIGEEITARVRYTTTAFDAVVVD